MEIFDLKADCCCEPMIISDVVCQSVYCGNCRQEVTAKTARRYVKAWQRIHAFIKSNKESRKESK